MSVGPLNVSFVPRDRLMILAPRSAAHRIARDVLYEEPSPLGPRARRAITLTWAAPAIWYPLSRRAATTPATPVPWNVPPAVSSSIGFVSLSMKSYPWVPSVLDHMFARMSLWVHHTPVSTTATITLWEPVSTFQARSAWTERRPHWSAQNVSSGMRDARTGKSVITRTGVFPGSAEATPVRVATSRSAPAARAAARRPREGRERLECTRVGLQILGRRCRTRISGPVLLKLHPVIVRA